MTTRRCRETVCWGMPLSALLRSASFARRSNF